MFGKYFGQILVLTLLAGIAYSLPQVKEAMVGAFSFSGSNEASIFNILSNSKSVERAEMQKPPIRMVENTVKVFEKRQVPPEEVIAILFKAGVIPKEKLPMALKVLKEHMENRKMDQNPNASSTRVMPTPLNASSTKPIRLDDDRDMRPVKDPVSVEEVPQNTNIQ